MAKAQRRPISPDRGRQKTGPVTRRPDLWLLLLSGAGVVLSAYLVWTRATHATVYCPLGGGCEVVQSSRFAAVFGIPVALLGLLFYAYLFLIAARPFDASRRAALALPAAFAGVGSSVVFMIVSKVIIRATCSLCVISALLSAAILIVLLARRPLRISPGTWATSAAALILAAAFLVWGYAASAPPAPEAAYAEALAKHLTATGAKLYGAYWCPHCTDQKEMFGKAVELLPYIECDPRSPIGKPAVCAAAGIRAFPTWDVGGTRHEGVLSFEELAKLSGFKAPP